MYSFYLLLAMYRDLFYWLNRKAKRIVTFHNIMPSNLLPNGRKIGLTDTEETFAMKINEIRKHFEISTNIDDSSSVTVTFDDGYRNEYEVSKKNAGVGFKGIIFVAGKLLNNGNPDNALVVDLLMHWIELVPDGTYCVAYHTLPEQNIKVTSHNRQRLWQDVIWPAFVADNSLMGYGLLKALDDVYAMDNILSVCSQEYLRLRLTGFSSVEIRKMRAEGWVIGWHTYEHFPLSALPKEQKEREIVGLASNEMRNYVMSYPYGEEKSVDNACIKTAKEAGYPFAVSNLPNANAADTNFFLPRITLSDNKYMLHFELSGLKYFIQNRKLLKRL